MSAKSGGTLPVFAEFCRPWLEWASQRLPIWGAHPEWADALAAQLSAVAARVLVAELKRWREAGLLQGATPTERGQDFFQRILTLPEMRAHLQAEYPLLFPLLDKITEHFCGNLEDALTRLRARTKGAGLVISRIETGLSDPHAQGRSVICFIFHDGKKLIYKPRSVRGEVWWADFIAWWNASGVSPEMNLRAPEASDHGDYGWCEFIEAHEDAGKSSAWFFRLGAHMAITWLFGIGDCHFGNFIGAGSHPVLVDAECVGSAFWHPKLPELPAGLPPLFMPAWRTPLTGGMFPPWMMPKVPGQPLYLAPGIGGVEDRPLPVKRPVWHGVGTDELRMELTAGLMSPVRSRAGTSTSPREIAGGFRVAAKHLLAHRSEVLQWMSNGHARNPWQIRPRILLRNTTAYQQILEAASGPKYLTSPESRLTALRTISRIPVIGGEEPEGLAEIELSHLNVQTYPRFVINDAGTHIVADDGRTAVLECSPEVSKGLARQHWRDLTDEKITWHSEMISAACRQAAELRITMPGGNNRFLLAAVEIGKALERQAMRTDKGASWLSLTSDAQANVVTQTPGGDFASGSAGPAVLLARLGETTGDQRWTDLALEAMRFSEHYWTRYAAFAGAVPWSAYYGAGSLFLAGVAAESLTAHPSIRAMLDRWLEGAHRDRSWLKMNGDHLAGLSGLAMALAALASEFPLAQDLLKPALTRLLEPSLSASLSTPGLAHGTAGWVMGVIAAARALGDDRAMSFARKVISTFSEQWAQFEARPSVQQDPPGGWCNGAIGLMAIAAEHPATSDCARDFFQKSRRWFAGGHGGHHFCCGEAGRVLLLAHAANLLSDAEFSAEARRCADAMLDHAGQHGFLVFQGIPERLTIPGWLNGISGVGAAMLAAHALHE